MRSHVNRLARSANTADGNEFALAEFTSDGSPDSTFGNNGVVLDDSGSQDNYATAAAFQPDGGIIVAGYSDSAGLDLVRYLPDGTEDPNFQNWNAAGVAAGAVYGIAIEPNNTILVGGSFDSENAFGVMSFNVDGSLADDMTLGPYSGSPDDNSAVCAMAIAPDGSVIEAGTQGHFWDPGYSSNVPLLARLYVGDIGGAQVRVDEASPALPLEGDGYVAAGDTYTVTLGTSSTGEGINLGSGSDVSYTINWGDGSPATTITADDLAAAGDQVSHVFNATTSGISVDLDVTGDPDSPYTGVGTYAVTVDTTLATTTALAISSSTPAWGGTETLTATVSTDLYGIATPTGTVEFYDGTIDLGPGTLNTYGVATLTTPPLFSGEHDFTAVYSGDDTYTGSTSTTATATVASAPSPSLTMTGASSIDEGATYTLALPTTAGGHTITSWVINWGDGSANSVLSGDPTSTTHAFGAGGTFSVTAIAINSSEDAYAASMGNTVTVYHVDPSGLTLTADDATYSGADVTAAGGLADDELHASFTGPESLGSYVVTINWGDGSGSDPDLTTFTLPPGTTTFDYPLRQYANTGAYTITVTVTDPETNSTSSTVDVNYTNSAPSALALSLDETTVYASDTPVLSGSFTDPQFNDSHVVTIDWGDGGGTPDTTTISLDAGETTFQADPHTYSTPGSYTISVVVAGIDGTVTNSMSVTVNDIPDQVMIGSLVPVAWESGGQMGQFTVTRVGPTSSALTVSYSLAGTATSGTDFTITDGSGTTLAGSVTIPAGQNSAMIVVSPTGEGGDGDTVIVTIASGSGYFTADGFSTATATTSANEALSGSGPVSASMTFFAADGTAEAADNTALVGDTIPLGIGLASGNATGKTFTIDYDSALITVSENGAVVTSGTSITLTTGYTIYDVSAADPGDNTPVEDEIDVDESDACSGGTDETLCSADANLGVLQMFMSGVAPSITPPGAPGPAKVGQLVSLEVERISTSEPPQVIGSGLTWSLPGQTAVQNVPASPQSTSGDYVLDFAPSRAQNQVSNFGPANSQHYTSAVFALYWVTGGSKQAQAVVVDPQAANGTQTVTGSMNVQRPSVNVTVTPNTALLTYYSNNPAQYGLGAHGVNSFIVSANNKQVAVILYGVPNGQQGITFVANGLTQHANGFTYQWVQVIQSDSLVPNIKNWLDTSFPYNQVGPVAAPRVSTSDSPDAQYALPIQNGGRTSRNFVATMWLMCTPDVAAGAPAIYVPLGSTTWHINYTAIWNPPPPGLPPLKNPLAAYFHITSAAPWPDPTLFSTVNAFPEWVNVTKGGPQGGH